MSGGFRKLGRGVVLVVAFLVVFEVFVILRWIFFSGREPSPLHDLQTGLGILIAIWAVSKLAGWFERREARGKEIVARIRTIDARVEALYKWGPLSFAGDDEEDNNDWEWELDDGTKAEIAEHREGIRTGDTTSRYGLGVIFWNRAMEYYNSHTKGGHRDAVRWLRKAASVDYNCENTLGGVYFELQDYDEAMYWYRRSLRRGGTLVWIAESNIADMYAGGQGVPVNYAEAAWWWERAAQHGSDWSHYKLGKLYAEGADGIVKDNRKAYFHLCIASLANGQYGPQKSAVELLERVGRELGEYFMSQENKHAKEWLANTKEIHGEVQHDPLKPAGAITVNSELSSEID